MTRSVNANFQAAMESTSRSPRQTAIFYFPVAGPQIVSDQASPFGLGDVQPLVIEWGDLIDMAGGDPQKDQAGEIRQMSITLWNGGDSPFSDLFLTEQPENVIVAVYQNFDGLTLTDEELIDTFVVQDPIEFDESSTLLKLDLVSLSMRYDNPIGEVITTANYPLANNSDIGKEIPIILGTPGEVGTIRSQEPPIATLDGSILTDTLTIIVKESLGDLDFPGQGTIEINGEAIRYFFRLDKSFVIAAPPLDGRGYDNTTATEHITGVKIKLRLASDFIVCKGPIQSIPTVLVGGSVADPADYSLSTDTDPVVISFPSSPKAISFATGATFLEMQFDDTNTENTAFQAFASYEGEENLAARLTETESLLSVKQVTVNPDRGEVVKAFLAVEHWEDGSFLNDFAEVSIEGIGVVGRLSRPTTESTVLIDAEVDLDHGHNHNISGEHTHSFTDPALAVRNPLHTHGFTGSTTTVFAPAGSVPRDFVVSTRIGGFPAGYPTIFNVKGQTVFSFTGLSTSWVNAVITISVSGFGARTIVGIYSTKARALGSVIGATPLASFEILSQGQVSTVSFGNFNLSAAYIRVTTIGTATSYNPSFTVRVNSISLALTSASTISGSGAGVSVDTTTPGANFIATDKSTDDVQDLVTGNQSIVDINSDTASSTVVNLFDITSFVDFDWSWFTDRDVTIEYKGTNDNRKIYIRHIFFDIEYRKKEVIFSDEITCDPVGLIDDGSGTITGTPNKLITRPDEVRKYMLVTAGGLSSGYIDSTSFAAAGNSYAGLIYNFDGVLDGDLTVRDVEKKLAFQCRSRWFWNGGKAKITLRNKIAEMSAVKFLTQDDLQLRSIKVKRQRVTDISNVIDLQYSKNWTDTGQKPFIKITSGSDVDSVSLNGNYEHRDKWNFDCVTGDTMAADLLDYYLDTQATPSTFYTFNVYLSQFDLEKGDVIALTSPFGKLIKALMEIKSIDRSFGSGRSKAINRLKITAESIKYVLLSIGLTDTVTVLDAITISFGDTLELADVIFVEEGVVFSITGNLADSVTVSDVILTISEFVTVLSETVTVSDAAAHSVGLNLSENQFVFDTIIPQIVIGFGGGGFGTGVRFGGLTLISEFLADIAALTELIEISQSTTFEDELTTIDEQLTFSSGYGTPVGDGFGGARYGS